MKRGEVWVANLNPNRGAEIGKIRPVLILQVDWLTAMPSRTVVVLPMTSQTTALTPRLRVTIPARDGLKHESHVLIASPRTLDRRRFGQGPLTTLTPPEMAVVERNLGAVLGLEFEV